MLRTLKSRVRIALALAAVSILAGHFWLKREQTEQKLRTAESIGSRPSITKRLLLIETRLDAVQREAGRLYRLLVESGMDARAASRTQTISVDSSKEERKDEGPEEAQW